ncbi:MAG: outer membrane beta-barrel protein [Gemmatimonadota bacterium]|nr:outer membrane beta-barrel protein [Gemmatimonadota bacterium]
MTSVRHALGAIAIGALCVTTSARAQTTATAAKTFTFGGAGGFSIPFGSWKDDLGVNTGYTLQAHGTWNTPMLPVALRAELGYTHWGYSANITGGKIDGSVREISFILNAVKPLTLSGSSVSPYWIAGLGAYNGKSDAQVSGGTFSTNSHTDVGVNGGAGINFALGGSSAFVEARLHIVFGGGNSNATNNNNTKTALFLPITFGFHY